MNLPSYTVLTNLVSPENNSWVGTSWEFFDNKEDAEKCRQSHESLGNCPTLRSFHLVCDLDHLGAAHKWEYKEYLESLENGK